MPSIKNIRQCACRYCNIFCCMRASSVAIEPVPFIIFTFVRCCDLTGRSRDAQCIFYCNKSMLCPDGAKPYQYLTMRMLKPHPLLKLYDSTAQMAERHLIIKAAHQLPRIRVPDTIARFLTLRTWSAQLGRTRRVQHPLFG